MEGYVHSFQSMGTLDGPGVRTVIFMQGCPLRCAYCHNPDTWEIDDRQRQQAVSSSQILQKVLKYKPYFGDTGGITVSGGEALLQAEFVKEIFIACHKEGISTCLDTSGCIINDAVIQLLEVTDMVLLDIKMTNQEDYKTYTGADLNTVIEFLYLLEKRHIPTWIRQVIIPGFNDTVDNFEGLRELLKGIMCIEKVEFLPFRKLCIEKYERMGIPFPFAEHEEGSEEIRNIRLW
ncbi:pyruvate formate-lyase-activating protein [Lachnospiraceae bacterium LCP25S3_G4]